MKRQTSYSLGLAAMAATGVAISIYLTSVHYQSVPLVCTSTGLVNCERVLSSSASTLAGIPISIGGILWFLVSGGLALVSLLRRPEPALLHPAQLLWSLLGLLTVLYLVGVEVLQLGVICAWCTALHALILASLFLALLRTPEPAEAEPAPALAADD